MENHKPVLIIIAGPNGSGKTTITQKVLHHEWLENAIYINPDQIAKDKFGDWNSVDAVLKSANYCQQQREKCLEDGQSLIFETVMEKGFFIRLFFVSTSHPSINAARVANRVIKGGHDVPIPKIISRYNKSITNCATVCKITDRTYVYDNSIDNQEARLLFRMSDGKLFKQYTDDIPQWARLILS